MPKVNMSHLVSFSSTTSYTTYPSSFSIPNISSPRPHWDPLIPSSTLATAPRTSYKYLSSTTPYRVFRDNLRKAYRRSGHRIDPYHPYRPDGKKLWTINEIEEDVYNAQLKEERRLRVYGGEGLGFWLGIPPAVSSRTTTPVYLLPSATASSEILGTPSPWPSGEILDEPFDSDEVEVLVEEERRSSWSSGRGSEGSSSLATPATDCDDPFAIKQIIVASPKAFTSSLHSPLPKRILDYTTLPLPPIPSRPPCTPPRPIYRPPTPPRPSPFRRSVSAPTPPTRPPRPHASQLPPVPPHTREPRRPPPLNLSNSMRHYTRHDLGLGPHPFANNLSTRPRELLPSVEIKSPRAYRIARLADTDLPAPYTSPQVVPSKLKHTIDVDLLSALDRLVNECGEGDINIDMDIELDCYPSSRSCIPDPSSIIHAFPLPPNREKQSATTTPISASSFHLQTPTTPPQHTRLPLMPVTPKHEVGLGMGMGKKRALSTGTRSDHSFLRGMASPTPSGYSVGSERLGSSGSSGSGGRGLPRRKGLPEGWSRF